MKVTSIAHTGLSSKWYWLFMKQIEPQPGWDLVLQHYNRIPAHWRVTPTNEKGAPQIIICNYTSKQKLHQYEHLPRALNIICTKTQDCCSLLVWEFQWRNGKESSSEKLSGVNITRSITSLLICPNFAQSLWNTSCLTIFFRFKNQFDPIT